MAPKVTPNLGQQTFSEALGTSELGKYNRSIVANAVKKGNAAERRGEALVDRLQDKDLRDVLLIADSQLKNQALQLTSLARQVETLQRVVATL
jgi:hypothetical protein